MEKSIFIAVIFTTALVNTPTVHSLELFNNGESRLYFKDNMSVYDIKKIKLQRHPVRRDKSVEDRSGRRPGCKSFTW